jgi:regulator of replication initiation timing
VKNIQYGTEFLDQLKDRVHDLYDENVKLKEEIERLNNIIKEAINYIDDNTYYKDHKGHINIDDLYIILKGVDK